MALVSITPLEKEIFKLAIWQAAGYTPNEGQTPFHEADNDLKLVAGGVRAGKSKSTAMEFAGELAVPDGLVWIVGPDYEQGKAEFEYLYEPLHRLGFVKKASRPEKGSRSMVLVNGCRVQTKSSDDARSLASFAPHAILMVEAAQQSDDIFGKVIERGLEHNAKIVLSGTFEGAASWYVDLFKKWGRPNEENGRAFSLPSWTNRKIFPLGRQDPKILRLQQTLPEELFDERVGAVPYKAQGLVFKKYGPQHVPGPIEYNPDWPIELAIDPASHTYAIEVVQWLGPRVRVIDEIYVHDTIAQDVIPIVMARPWWPYIKENAGVIDVAGKQHHGNKSQQEIWRQMAGVSLRAQYVKIDDGINRLKLALEETDDEGPLLQFDYRLNNTRDFRGRANGILGEFDLFRWRDWKEGQASPKTPIDSNCDGVKALWYWLYDKFGPVTERESRTFSRRRAAIGV